MALALRGGTRVSDALRNGPGTSIIARIENDRVLLDLRSLHGEDLEFVAEQIVVKLESDQA